MVRNLPFSGAATGVGGRIRDTHAIGRGGIISAIIPVIV